MRPIPKSLLGDTALVEEATDSSSWGSIYDEPWQISNVRLDTDVTKAHTEWCYDAPLSAILFIDAINSNPPKCPNMRARVTVERPDGTHFKGTVSKVRHLIGFGTTIHHWEVALT